MSNRMTKDSPRPIVWVLLVVVVAVVAANQLFPEPTLPKVAEVRMRNYGKSNTTPASQRKSGPAADGTPAARGESEEATTEVAKGSTDPSPEGQRSGGQDTGGASVSAGAEGTTPQVVLASVPSTRDLFQPLVLPKGAGGKRVTKPVPTLPAAGAAGSSASSGSTSSGSGTPSNPSSATPAAPSGVQVSDLQLLGVTESDSGPRVLIKRSSTNERRFFGQGEPAFGFTVKEIKGTEVVLDRDGKSEKLEMASTVSIEGPGAVASAGSSGFSGFGRGGFGGGGGFGGDGFSRRDRGADRGSDRGGGSSTTNAFSTAQLFSLPTWGERLKKLEEVKSQIDTATYDRLKKFMSDKVKSEGK